MALLTDADLQAFSDLAEGFFDKSCEILRASQTPDSQGGGQDVYAVVATVNCLLVAEQRQPAENVVGQQVVREVPKTVLFPRGTDVRDDDKLRIDGVRYHIRGVAKGSSYEVMPKATVREGYFNG